MPIRDIYVKVNVLEKITARQHITLAEREKMFDKDRRSFGTTVKTKDGLETVAEKRRIPSAPQSGESE